MPEKITHSWLEVEIDQKWHQIDTYINDLALHNAAISELARRGWKTGFSVSAAAGEPSAYLNLSEAQFSQMAAVVGDYGTWQEPNEFFNSSSYLNRPSVIKQYLYRLYLPIVNRRIRKLREKYV